MTNEAVLSTKKKKHLITEKHKRQKKLKNAINTFRCNNNNNNNNNNSIRMGPTFIIHEKFQNLPDMPDACRMKMSLMEAEKLKPWREDGVFARTKR